MDDHKIECPFCGKKIVDGIPFCPYCGKKQPEGLSRDEINKNPYTILEISKNAELEVIEAAYKSLAKKYHPDSGSISKSEERMQDINWAHSILTDPEKLSEWKLKNRKKKDQISATKTQTSTIDKTIQVNKTESQSISNKETETKSTASKFPQSTSQPEPKINSTPTLIYVGIAISIIVLFWLFISLSNSTNNSSGSQYVPPPPTQGPRYIYSTPVPTHFPTRIPSQIPTTVTSNCTFWSNVSKYDVNYSKCVYGRIVKIYGTDQYAQIIRFSNEAGTFLIWSKYWYFSNVYPNECVKAIGYIKQNASELYMDIENMDLYSYNGCP